MAQQNKEEQKKLLTEIMEADQKSGLYEDTNKMVTAVDWFYQQTVIEGKTNYWELLGQAKQMEKEQIIYAHLTGLIHPLETEATKQAEQYYNETYGKETDTR